MVYVRSWLLAVAAGLAVMVMVVAGVSPSNAQDATPMTGMEMAGIPNHIHAGTCDELGDVVVPLADLQYTNEATDGEAATPMAGMDMATPMTGAGMASGAGAAPVAVGTTQVDLALTDILAADHAFNTHDPAEPGNPDRYLACGNIGGTPDPQGNLFVGLEEDNDSGFTGVAWLLDNTVSGGTGTTVTIFLVGGDAASAGMDSDMMATPAA
ncbi:MAG: hypothetical protein M3411_01360 [Chloroflexota bacterium]|nr:hypothetical protein [Chloroflexota bacterium]